MHRSWPALMPFIFLGGLVRPGDAQETPSTAEASQAGVGDVCGFIETVWDGFEWALATSDRILRNSDCIAECEEEPENWFDRWGRRPCYAGTRFWKVDPAFGAAAAFPMASLGSGTFDGLMLGFVTNDFQLYDGLLDNPVGPLIEETRPITVTFWRDVNPPCEPLDSSTIYIPGGAGGLAYYSIVIFGANHVDMRADTNNDGTVDLASRPDDCSDWGSDECREYYGYDLWIPVNNNDSDGDGVRDHVDTIRNGPKDDDQFFDVFLRIIPGTEDAAAVRLETSQASRFRLFDEQGNQVLGAGALDADGQPIGWGVDRVDFPITSVRPCAWRRFSLEGVMPGSVGLVASVVDSSGSLLAYDFVHVQVYRVRSFFPDAGFDPTSVGDSLTLSVDDRRTPFVTSVDWTDNLWREITPGEATLIEYSIVAGSPTLSTSSATTRNGFASTLVTAPTTAGQSFRLRSRLVRLEMWSGGWTFTLVNPFEQISPELVVVAGAPSSVYPWFNGSVNSFPASERNSLTLRLTSFDEAGNLSPDGTGVVADLTSEGSIDPTITEGAIRWGEARVGTVAGFASGARQLTVTVGEREASRTLEQVPIDIDVTPSATSIPTGMDQFVDLLATVGGSDGSAVADGTEVSWVTSLGSFATDAGARIGPVAVTTVTAGQSLIRLYTAAVDSLGQVISGTDLPGSANIIAAIGLSQGRTTVEFTGPTVLELAPQPRLQVDRRALAGNATTDGTIAVDHVAVETRYDLMIRIRNNLDALAAQCPECDLDGDGLITLIDLVRARTVPSRVTPAVPYYAGTQGIVTGNPGDVVQISVSDPSLITVLRVNDNGEVTLDAAGQAAITLQSTGALKQEVALVSVVARLAGTTAIASTGHEVRLVLVPKEDYGVVYSFLAGAVWGGGEGAAAFAGDAVVSFFLLGDIRDIVVEGSKLWPGGEDPDGLTTTFAALGIAATAGGPMDAGITLMKRGAKQLNRLIPGTSGAKLVKKVIDDILKQFRDGGSLAELFDQWHAFFRVVGANDGFVQLLGHLGKDLVDASRRIFVRFGECWAGYFVRAATDLSILGAKKALRIIDAVDDATVAVLKGWPPARQERLVLGLANCRGKLVDATADSQRWAGKIDDDVLKDLLDKDKIAAIEQIQAQFPEFGTGFDATIEQLGNVAGKGTENANTFAKRLRDIVVNYLRDPGGPNLARLKGHLNELEELATLADDASVASLRTGVRLPENQIPAKEPDAIAEFLTGEKIIYEFKHGTSFANPGQQQRDKVIEQVMGYVELAKRAPDVQGARVVVRLRGGTWSSSLKQRLVELGNSGIVVEVQP